MPIIGLYGPDDFANRPQGQHQGQATASPRAAPARTGPTLPTPSLAWTPEVARVALRSVCKIVGAVNSSDRHRSLPCMIIMLDMSIYRA